VCGGGREGREERGGAGGMGHKPREDPGGIRPGSIWFQYSITHSRGDRRTGLDGWTESACVLQSRAAWGAGNGTESIALLSEALTDCSLSVPSRPP